MQTVPVNIVDPQFLCTYVIQTQTGSCKLHCWLSSCIHHLLTIWDQLLCPHPQSLNKIHLNVIVTWNSIDYLPLFDVQIIKFAYYVYGGLSPAWPHVATLISNNDLIQLYQLELGRRKAQGHNNKSTTCVLRVCVEWNGNGWWKIILKPIHWDYLKLHDVLSLYIYIYMWRPTSTHSRTSLIIVTVRRCVWAFVCVAEQIPGRGNKIIMKSVRRLYAKVRKVYTEKNSNAIQEVRVILCCAVQLIYGNRLHGAEEHRIYIDFKDIEFSSTAMCFWKTISWGTLMAINFIWQA